MGAARKLDTSGQNNKKGFKNLRTITVTQEPTLTLSLSGNWWMTSANPAMTLVDITTNAPSWTATTTYDWLMLGSHVFSGPNTLAISATPNQSTTSRTGTVRILAPGANSQTVTVMQAGRISVTGVRIDSASTRTMNANSTLRLTAILTPANPTNQNVTWSTNNPSVIGISANGLNVEITGRTPGNAVLTVTTADGNRSHSITVHVIDPQLLPPAVPTNLTFTNTTHNSTTLSWLGGFQNVNNFRVYRTSPLGSVFVGTTTGMTMNISGLTPETFHTFYVVAVGTFGTTRSANATVRTANIIPPATNPLLPAPPTNLTFTNTTASSTTLSWLGNFQNVNNFRVYRVSPLGSVLVGTATGTSMNITGLTADTNHTFYVVAVGTFGRATSERASVMTLPATLNLSRDELSFEVDGGSETVHVTSNITWRVTEHSEWLRPSITNYRQGDALMTIRADANTTGERRYGEVIISGGGLTRIITVGQDAFIWNSDSSRRYDEQGRLRLGSVRIHQNVPTISLVDIQENHERGFTQAAVESWLAQASSDWEPDVPSRFVSGSDRTATIQVFAGSPDWLVEQDCY